MSSLKILLLASAGLTCLLQFGPTTGQSTDPPYLVYVLYQQAVRVANIDGSNPRTLVDGIYPVYVQYDLRRGYVYWTTENGPTHTIQRASLSDGADVVVLRTANTGEAFGGIALDWVNNRLYYCDKGEDEIEVYDLNNNTYWTVITHNNQILTPLGIAVDPMNEWIFWVDFALSTVVRASLSGENQRNIYQGNHHSAHIAIDLQNQRIYINTGSNRIESLNTDGSAHSITVSTSTPMGVSYYSGTLYFADWRNKRIRSVQPGDGASLTSLLTDSSAVTGTHDVRVVHLSKQPLPDTIDECTTSLHNCHVNAVCTDMESGYTCACNQPYIGDGRTCIAMTTYPVVVSTPTGGQACPSDDQLQNILNGISSDVRSIVENSTTSG